MEDQLRAWWVAAALALVVAGLIVLYHSRRRKQCAGNNALSLRGLYECTSIGIHLTDIEGNILDCNEAYASILGVPRTSALGANVREFTPAAFHEPDKAQREMGLRTGSCGPYEKAYRRPDGSIVPVRAHGKHIAGPDGHPCVWSISEDISDKKRAEDAIHRLAFYDALTFLPNRRLFFERLTHAIVGNARTERHGALLYVDLDNFKTLNDAMGHGLGDELLQVTAKRFITCVREADTVARLGGDEFVVLLENLSTDINEAAMQAEMVAEKVRAAGATAYQLGDYQHHLSASIGIVVFNGHEELKYEDLLKQADLAMYQAKEAGRNTIRFYDPRMQDIVEARIQSENELRLAVRTGQLALHFHPQVNIGERCLGAEAMVCWHHPRLGLIEYADFIGMAPGCALAIPLSQWALEETCVQLAAWARRPAMAYLNLAVDVAVKHFQQPDFVDQVQHLLTTTGANPDHLRLELALPPIAIELESAIQKMGQLHELGVGLVLDHFGASYAALAQIKRMPLRELKIDPAFIKGVPSNQSATDITETIVKFARSLGLGVVAEGVDTEEQCEFLAQHGCRVYQGYHADEALSKEAFETYATIHAVDNVEQFWESMELPEKDG